MKEGLGITLILIILGWLGFYYQGNIDYSTRYQAISNITYRYTQTAGKKGELNDTIYSDLNEKLSFYGSYKITVLAEKFQDDGILTLKDDDVIDYDLRSNDYDILTIYVESDKEHWLNKVMEISPFGNLNNNNTNYKIIAKSSVYIQ